MNYLEEANTSAWEMIERYLNLEINGITLPTPYYTNNIGGLRRKVMKNAGVSEEKIDKVNEVYKNKKVNYGWYRGKGTPEQIEQVTEELSRRVGLKLRNSKYGILEFMKLYGLGIDCSGFVYNVLKYTFEKIGQAEQFKELLVWKSEKQNVDHAGVFAFQKPATIIIEPKDTQPLDLITIKKGDKHTHICLIVKKGGNLKTAQSSIATEPAGVTVTDFKIKKDQPVFGFQPTLGKDWEELYEKGSLTFRRLVM